MPPGAGQIHYETILSALALARADGKLSYDIAIQQALTEVSQGSVMVLFDSTPESTQQVEPPAFYARHIKPVWVCFDTGSFIDPVQVNHRHNYEQIGDIPVYHIRRGDNLAAVFGTFR